MIFGTSICLSKSGPVDLLTITKMLQRIQEKYGDILEHIIFVNLGLMFLKMFEQNVCPRYHDFVLLSSRVSHLFEYLIFILIFTKMRIENDEDRMNKIHKSLDMNFKSIKKHEMEIWQNLQTFLVSRKGII